MIARVRSLFNFQLPFCLIIREKNTQNVCVNFISFDFIEELIFIHTSITVDIALGIVFSLLQSNQKNCNGKSYTRTHARRIFIFYEWRAE